MTTLLSWIGVDSRALASIYLASDSRISWDNKTQWDVGRKLFASKTKPEMFGYCGDVTFPIQILGQIIEQIDNGLLFSEQESYQNKLEKIRSVIEDSFFKLPKVHQRSFHILYATRINSGMASEFFLAEILLASNKIKSKNIPIKDKNSDLIISLGSGEKYVKNWHYHWAGSEEPKDNDIRMRTSRSVFSSFCDSLESRDDPLSGGAPQLVGLYRIGAAITFGVIYNNERYFNGLPVKTGTILKKVEWRNRLFERCDGESLVILKGAQKQPRPNTIKTPD